MKNAATQDELTIKKKIIDIFAKSGSLLRKEVAAHLNIKGLEPRRHLKTIIAALLDEGVLQKEKSKHLSLHPEYQTKQKQEYPASDILKKFSNLSGKNVKIGVYQDLQKSIGPVHRKNDRFKYKIPQNYWHLLENDDLVACVFDAQKLIDVVKIGSVHNETLFPLMSVLSHGLSFLFSKESYEDAKEFNTVPSPSKTRKDYTNLSFVTIDGEDAKDFDDAVYVEEIITKKGSIEGYKVYVAIADVSYYVRPNTALDREAFERGNSVYLAGCVIPMLPEILSNELCSLKPNEDRAAFVCEMTLSADGILKEYTFKKGVINSKARLTYTQVQDVLESKPHVLDKSLIDGAILPLFNVYKMLRAKRQDRGALDLDMPEYQATFDETGFFKTVLPRKRLSSHELIEELMILANVAAARMLSDHKVQALYRVHDEPESSRLHSLRETLEHFNLSIPKGKKNDVTPRQFADLLRKAVRHPQAHLIQELILRSQAQAIYSPYNKGHFGLALSHYAHFTSPIRRYADLVVHRALSEIAAVKDSAYVYEQDMLKNMGSHLSSTERVAAACEREVLDRYNCLLFEKDVGQIFEVIIAGVNSTGLFVRNPKTGGEGYIPVHSLDDDYYVYDQAKHRFFGRRTKRSLQVGDFLLAKLLKADPVLSSVIFEAILTPKSKNKTQAPSKKNAPTLERRKKRVETKHTVEYEQKNFKKKQSKKKSKTIKSR